MNKYPRLIPAPCRHCHQSDNLKVEKGRKGKHIIFKNIHSKMRSLKIQVSRPLSHPARPFIMANEGQEPAGISRALSLYDLNALTLYFTLIFLHPRS